MIRQRLLNSSGNSLFNKPTNVKRKFRKTVEEWKKGNVPILLSSVEWRCVPDFKPFNDEYYDLTITPK